MAGIARNWTALALAAAVAVALVGCGSDGSSTAPTSQGSTQRAPKTEQPQPAPAEKSKSAPAEEKSKPVPSVKVIGGAPPTARGPAQLSFHLGERVRFRVVTDEPFSFEVLALGIAKTVDSSATVSFKATKVGQFPVIASATSIGVADLIVSGR